MLLTYNEYNKDLGYVQGMSDLLAPIYAVEQDDAVAFWGFVGFMDRMVSSGAFIALSIPKTVCCRFGILVSTVSSNLLNFDHDIAPFRLH